MVELTKPFTLFDIKGDQLIIATSRTKRISVITPMGGTMIYNPIGQSVIITDGVYTIKYTGVSPRHKGTLKTEVSANDIIGHATQVQIGNTRYLNGYTFEVENKDSPIHPLDFLMEIDKEEIVKKEDEELLIEKDIKIKNETKKKELVEREGKLYINIDDLSDILTIESEKDTITFKTKRKKKGES